MPLLEARGLECVRGERRLFTAVDLALCGGELMRVAGANGSGKTSLLRILCGLSTPEAGEVRWRGQDIRAAAADYRADLVFVGHAAALKDELSAIENLRLRIALAGAKLDVADARAAFERLGLSDAIDLPTRLLSQGQRRRVTLARLLVAPGATVWILDEPFAALDPDAVQVIEAAIAGHLDRGGAAVLTTHQETGVLRRLTGVLDLGAGAPC